MENILFESARSMAQKIRKGELSCVQVVKIHLERIEKVNGVLNAVVTTAPERALAAAAAADRALAKGDLAGPLHGVPITIKDSLDTAGIVSTWGSVGRAHHIPEKDATVVARLRAAGAIILGKTNTPEITQGVAMDNDIFGPSYNPHDLTKSPSGSSGGAAAIIAAGGSPLDLGSDTGGSIRSPAHVCGITGIKPTYGRTPRTGHAVPYGTGAVDRLTQIGPMARFVEDLSLCLPIICGADGRDPSLVPAVLGDPSAIDPEKLRIAYYVKSGLPDPDPDICNAVLQTASLLAEAGLRVEKAAPRTLKLATDLYPRLKYADGGALLWRLLKEAGTQVPSPPLAEMLDYAKKAITTDLCRVLEQVDRFCSEMLSFMANYDAILCPPDLYPALPHEDKDVPSDQSCKLWGHMTAYNLTGWPAGVVRAGQTDKGLPIGVQVVARPFREDVVLALLQRIETLGGGYRRPIGI